MQGKKICALLLALFSSGLQARDHVPSSSTNGSLEYNPIDGTIMSQSKQYPKSIEGLRQYLDEELTKSAKDYTKLDSKLQGLESQSKTAATLAMIPVGLGFGSLLVGSWMRQDQEPTDARAREIHEQGGRLMLYGVGGLVGGFLLYSALAPGDEELRTFIRFHNGAANIRPEQKPLVNHDSLSLNLLSGDKLITLSYRF